jgi:hypothetical protein
LVERETTKSHKSSTCGGRDRCHLMNDTSNWMMWWWQKGNDIGWCVEIQSQHQIESFSTSMNLGKPHQSFDVSKTLDSKGWSRKMTRLQICEFQYEIDHDSQKAREDNLFS